MGSIRRRRVCLDTAAIPDLLKQAVDERQIKTSLHAAEGALAEELTRREIEQQCSAPKWITPTQRGGSKWVHQQACLYLVPKELMLMIDHGMAARESDARVPEANGVVRL